jgi:hypothetical protein
MTSHRATRAAILACAILGILMVGPASPAHAGTYRVFECNPGASAAAAPDAVYHASTGASAFNSGNSCSDQNGGLGVYGSGNAGSIPDQSWWEFDAPSGTLIRQLNFGYRAWNSCGVDAYVQARDAQGNAQLTGTGPSAPDFFNCGVGPSGCATSFCVISNSGQLMSATNILAVAYCGGDHGVQACVPSPPYTGGFVMFQKLDATLEDLQRPSGPALSGSLVQGGPRRGTESLVVNAGDVGSGVKSIDVYVNGGPVDHSDLACDAFPDGSARRFAPCQSSVSDTFSAPTESPPWHEGTNSLRVCAIDFGGLDGCTDTTVNVDNSCDDSTGTTVGSNLDAGLATGTEQPRVNTVVSSNDSVQIKGSVTTSSGVPVAGANVCVYEQIATRGEDRVLADIVHTKSNGSYTSRIDAGPSRTVYVDYRHSNLLLEKQLGLSATTSPQLTIRKKHIHNGHSMRFKGSIPGPYNSGRTVIMQARVGSQWRTFKQVTTDTVGGFKGRYKFKHSTLARAKYTFRALVPRQDGYPFEAGTSNKSKVIVKG